MPVSADFKIGTGDPTITPDRGAGPWGSKSKEVLTAAKYVGIIEILGVAYVAIGDDAVKHMSHYLGNSGSALTIDLEGMIAEVLRPSSSSICKPTRSRRSPSSAAWELGRHSTHAVNGYNTKAESTNWLRRRRLFGVAKGKATIVGTGRGHDCALGSSPILRSPQLGQGQSVTIAGIKVSDEAMGEFHREGMAKEYDEIGVVRRKLHWKAP
jgi:hypothetical protein